MFKAAESLGHLNADLGLKRQSNSVKGMRSSSLGNEEVLKRRQ